MLFNTFPDNPQLYSPNLQPIVSETIHKYGKEEWKAAVLTCGIHGHIGIYAILGVKMGIRAIEYLKTEQGKISIHSFAGVKPPVSCFNDGLQVSTGATLGHGLITSPHTMAPITKAVFTELETGNEITMQLKDGINEMIKEEIAGAVKKYGHAPAYWEYVKELAITYWKNLNRADLFDIMEK